MFEDWFVFGQIFEPYVLASQVVPHGSKSSQKLYTGSEIWHFSTEKIYDSNKTDEFSTKLLVFYMVKSILVARKAAGALGYQVASPMRCSCEPFSMGVLITCYICSFWNEKYLVPYAFCNSFSLGSKLAFAQSVITNIFECLNVDIINSTPQ